MLNDSFIPICAFSTYTDFARFLSSSLCFSFDRSYDDYVSICKNMGYNSLRSLGNDYWIKINSMSDCMPYILCLSK